MCCIQFLSALLYWFSEFTPIIILYLQSRKYHIKNNETDRKTSKLKLPQEENIQCNYIC